MTDGAPIPETVVFDAGPLVAYFCDEPGSDTVEAYVDAIEESGVRRVDTAQTWPIAAEFKFRHSPALGDAFALGTAAHVDEPLVGADDDYDDVTDVAITRVRTEGV